VKFHVSHTTTYQYSDSVAVCHNQVHLTPRESPRQTCFYHRLRIQPTPSTTGRRQDYFGNPLNYFSIHEAHRKLTLRAVSKVAVQSRPPLDPARTLPWEQVVEGLRNDFSSTGLAAFQYQFDSPRVPRSALFAEYARVSFSPGRPILEAALDLTDRIHRDFKYDAGATSVQTPALQAFEARHGVCQDFAHVQIGCLRSLGLASRYVSGYLLTHPPPGRPRLVGVDASHAWLALYCGPLGWIDFDPTNNVITDTEHITLAWGRDYGDVCPVEGVFVGGGQHRLSVAVDVAPLTEEAA
jgi:transglutaminase-like putative cysteine protease